MSGPIIVGVGGNLPTAEYGPPRALCGAALHALTAGGGVRIAGRSRWYETAPVPVSDQPWFVNGAVAVETDLSPAALLARLLDTETCFGRRRSVPNAARTIDLDLLVYGDQVLTGDPEVPHPRLHGRAFALLPIRDLAPDWRHPVLGGTADSFIRDLPPDQGIRPMVDADGYLGTEWRPN